ncbi:unnamed protein product, partial [Candidula unifasciata]
LQVISDILSSRERLDLITNHEGDHDDTGSATDSSRFVTQGPDGKLYQPIPVRTVTENTEQQTEHPGDTYEYGVFGLGACKPKWSQRLANLNVFVVVYGVAGIWMITLSGFLGSQVTSIERHLGISSSKTGFILSSNEIGYLVFVILGSHLGKYTHIPVFLSVSGLVFGLATLAMALGRLETPRVWQDATDKSPSGAQSSTFDSSAKYLCDSGFSASIDTVLISTNSSTFSPNISGDLSPSRSVSWVFYLLVFCTIIGGAVKSYRIPLLTYYIESNIVNKNRSALLLGASFTAMLLGPPVSLFLGSFSSSLPVDLKETNMSKHDQRWVGAWWLGFSIIGLACIICSVPIMFFPRHMRKLKTRNLPETTQTTSLRVMLQDLPKSLGRCFRRPIYVLAVILNCIEGLAFSGSFAFYQKYMETQFNKTSQEISTVTGVITLFTIVMGTFCGGLITTKLKLGLRGCAAMTLGLATVTILLNCLYLLFGCENSDIVGMAGNRTLALDACDCSQDVFIVCGENQVNYLSPCLAGCRNATTDMIFTNCTRINNGHARPGMCDLDCPYFIPYLINFSIGYFLGTLTLIPQFLLTVRSVEQRDQSLASGTTAFCQTLIGILPSPILFGKMIDMSCSLWSPSGNCILYDRDRFRYNYYGVYLGLRFASLGVIGSLLWLTHKDARRESSKPTSKTTEE